MCSEGRVGSVPHRLRGGRYVGMGWEGWVCIGKVF